MDLVIEHVASRLMMAAEGESLLTNIDIGKSLERREWLKSYSCLLRQEVWKLPMAIQVLEFTRGHWDTGACGETSPAE